MVSPKGSRSNSPKSTPSSARGGRAKGSLNEAVEPSKDLKTAREKHSAIREQIFNKVIKYNTVTRYRGCEESYTQCAAFFLEKPNAEMTRGIKSPEVEVLLPKDGGFGKSMLLDIVHQLPDEAQPPGVVTRGGSAKKVKVFVLRSESDISMRSSKRKYSQRSTVSKKKGRGAPGDAASVTSPQQSSQSPARTGGGRSQVARRLAM